MNAIKYMIKTTVALFAVLFFSNSSYATEPLAPSTNRDCASARLTCQGSATHSFDNWVSEESCTSAIIEQYYYFYTSSGGPSIDVSFSGGTMKGYTLYGPLSNNLPDACEQFTHNAATVLATSTSVNSLYSVSSSSTLPAGLYLLKIKLDVCDAGTITFTPKVNNILCAPEVPCENCVASFELIPEKRYMISAWVKEDGAPVTKTSYDNPQIILAFPSVTITLPAFTPSGIIIDGWQRIEAEFTVPTGATDMQIQLVSLSGDVYFDDIRVFPFDASMKSYVYDPITLRLMAELDERNYATIYEYDEEGKLVRVKKETERGVMTIQENKTSVKKGN